MLRQQAPGTPFTEAIAHLWDSKVSMTPEEALQRVAELLEDWASWAVEWTS